MTSFDRGFRTVLASALTLLAVPVLAADYFVRTDGSDTSTGTANTAAGAWRTVGKCLANAGAGDRCLIQSGTYRETGITQSKAGAVVNGSVRTDCTCTGGSSTVTCGGAPTVNAGQFVRCATGPGFAWTEVQAVSGSTITLKEGYRGPSSTTPGADKLSSANFVQILGQGATKNDVVITSWVPKPSNVTFTKEAGTSCTWSFSPSSTTDPTWSRSAPYGFRDKNVNWDTFRLNHNGRDGYLCLNGTNCPCGEGKTIPLAVDALPGSWNYDASKVYVHTRRVCVGGSVAGFSCYGDLDCVGGGTCGGCQDPASLAMEASNTNPGAAMVTSQQPYTVIANITFETGQKNSPLDSKSQNLAAVLGASEARYSNLDFYTGALRFAPVASGGPSTNTLYEHIRALDSTFCGTVAGNYSGLRFYDVEIRGNEGNLISCDQLKGNGPNDRIVFDRLFLHRNFTSYLGQGSNSGSCNGNAVEWDCNTGYWAGTNGSRQYRGNHAMYMGSVAPTTSQHLDNVMIRNSILEITSDGLSLFGGENASDIWWVNNTFGVYENDMINHNLKAKFGCFSGNCASGTGNVGNIYNNLFLSKFSAFTSEGWIDRESNSSAAKVKSDYNLFLKPNVAMSSSNDRVWESGETFSSVIQSYGQETHSIMVCKSGCTSATPGTYFASNGDFKLTDVSVKDGTPTNYTPLTGFWGINKASNAYCPTEDFYGKPRNDGQCDIGAVEFGGSSPDTTPPNPVTSFGSTPANAQVTLNWTDSNSSDTKGTVVRGSTSGYPATRSDGTLVCDKTGTPSLTDSCVHAGLTNGQTWYYAAFAYDGAGNYSSASQTSGTPAAPPNPPPGTVPNNRRNDIH